MQAAQAQIPRPGVGELVLAGSIFKFTATVSGVIMK
jgi:hypothetical protein